MQIAIYQNTQALEKRRKNVKILTVGDIFGRCGVDHLGFVLPALKAEENIDFCIANGENASGSGIGTRDYDAITDAGVDVITLGNHTFGKKDVYSLFDNCYNILRPANYPCTVAGKGSAVFKCGGKRIGVINLMGRVNIPISLDCPFGTADREIEKIRKECDVIVVDFHAEATSEKKAMMYHLDSKVNVLFGTHTHIQTGDETITPRGMGYITDIGMTGAEDSVLGVEKDIILERFITGVGKKFEYSSSKPALWGAIFTIDDETLRCTSVKRVCVR